MLCGREPEYFSKNDLLSRDVEENEFIKKKLVLIWFNLMNTLIFLSINTLYFS